MVPLQQLQEARELLENAQNPLFLYDNDVDGLCSFLLLRRALGRGRGVAIKSFPELKEQYLQKVEEHNPDAVIVLDKAEVSPEFIAGLEEKNLPLLWLDHHESKSYRLLEEHALYLNTLPLYEPTTFIAYTLFPRREDLWLAMIGCIGDCFMPPFAHEFEKLYPELFTAHVSALDSLNTSEIGKMSRMLNFGLMDSTTNVVKLVKYLFTVSSPYDLLEENQYTKDFHKKYAELNTFLQKQVSKAEDSWDKNSKVIVHTYAGLTSMSSLIANRIFYKYPDRIVVVGFKKPDKVNVSMRGPKVLDITLEAVKGIDGATGGGHEVATGATVPLDDWEVFIERVRILADTFSK